MLFLSGLHINYWLLSGQSKHAMITQIQYHERLFYQRTYSRLTDGQTLLPPHPRKQNHLRDQIFPPLEIELFSVSGGHSPTIRLCAI